MCGIAGKARAEGAVSAELLDRMCEAIEHRGPDSRGMHRDEGVGLGIQRLRVIDLETGDQPIYSEDGSIAVVLNGEIYDFRALREELRGRGHRFSTAGDTEVIVHLYEELGDACVERLAGMFAFALWDSRRRRLLIGRDRLGKKPLYYWSEGRQLSFASELAALIEDPDVPRRLDPDAIDSYMAYGYIPAPLSIWRDVRKLPAASTLTFEPGSGQPPEIQRYWKLDYSNRIEGGRRELEEELRRQVSRAVRRRLISDVPLGAFLSGGVDSAIVVAEMARAMSEPVKTFSIGSTVPAQDELPGARRIAERFGTDHHELRVEPDAIELIPTLVRHYGEPYADSSALPAYHLAQFASRHVTVALNGDGGDENFAGYLRHAANAATRGVDRLPAAAREGLARLGGRLPSGSRTLGARAHQLLSSLGEDPVDRYRRHLSITPEHLRRRLFSPELESAIDRRVSRRMVADPWSAASGEQRLDVMLEVDVSLYLPYDLLTKIDIATMAHSLEARSPFLDHELMEFAAALPPQVKLSMLRKKHILRRAYREVIPAETLRGRKRGFVIPIDAWLRGELREHAREALLGGSFRERGLIDEGAVAELLSEHASGHNDHSQPIWALLMLEEWQRQFDRAPQAVG